MQEYKTCYFQMQEMLEWIVNGWEVESIEEYQGYMSVCLTKDDGSDEPLTRIFDFDRI